MVEFNENLQPRAQHVDRAGSKNSAGSAGRWWHTPLIPALVGGRGRRISEFEASLVYRVRSRTARAIQRNPVSKQTNKQNKKTKKEIDHTGENTVGEGWRDSSTVKSTSCGPQFSS
jgi:hypothetical protein